MTSLLYSMLVGVLIVALPAVMIPALIGFFVAGWGGAVVGIIAGFAYYANNP